ncbi:MAG: hypothetical protein OXC05_17165 [Halieaceae bacterium]|nr:hypothetical protein [Halieaceae bacterium]
MNELAQRLLVYLAAALVSTVTVASAGWLAGAGLFLVAAAMAEALFWFGVPKPGFYRYRQQRTLFH